MEKELILFVPGMSVEHRGQYLDMLHDGLKRYCTGRGISYQSSDHAAADGSSIKSLDLPEQGRRVEIQEVYWSDLVPLLSQCGVVGKVLRGAGLLSFWAFNGRLWRSVVQAKYMTLSMILTLLLFLLWYATALLAGLEAVASKPEIFGVSVLPAAVEKWVESIAGWQSWLIVSTLLVFLPTTEVLDISYGTKAYLQNLNGLAQKVRTRLARAINSVEGREDYGRITVVAHSFGSVVATEVLADYSGPAADKIRFVTLGGPLLVMGARSPRIDEAAQKLLDGMRGGGDHFHQWLDFYSHQDWLCTASVLGGGHTGYESLPLEAKVSTADKYTGKSHQLYFQDFDVMEAILAP